MPFGAYDYLENYIRQVEYGQECLDALMKLLDRQTLTLTQSDLDAIHEIENQADAVNHHIKSQLRVDFLVPYNRDAMSVLADTLDDVVDSVEDIALCAYMLVLEEKRPAVDHMMRFMGTAMKGLASGVLALKKKGRFAKDVHEAVVQINNAESECDKIYISRVRAMYEDRSMDPEERRLQHEFFKSIERSMDVIEHAGEALETIAFQSM